MAEQEFVEDEAALAGDGRWRFAWTPREFALVRELPPSPEDLLDEARHLVERTAR